MQREVSSPPIACDRLCHFWKSGKRDAPVGVVGSACVTYAVARSNGFLIQALMLSMTSTIISTTTKRGPTAGTQRIQPRSNRAEEQSENKRYGKI